MIAAIRKFARAVEDVIDITAPRTTVIRDAEIAAQIKPEAPRLRLFETIQQQRNDLMDNPQENTNNTPAAVAAAPQKVAKSLPTVDDAYELPKKRTQWFKEKFAFLATVEAGKTFAVNKPSEWTNVIAEYKKEHPEVKFTIRRMEDNSFRAFRQA